MYACIPEIDGGFFEGVCAPCTATAYFRDPPHAVIREWRYALSRYQWTGRDYDQDSRDHRAWPNKEIEENL
jgi:hypothetical protein